MYIEDVRREVASARRMIVGISVGILCVISLLSFYIVWLGIKAERKREMTEITLRNSERRLTDIVNFLPDATLVIDKDRKVLAWNRALEEMTGIPATEMLGKGDYGYALPFYGVQRPILIDLLFKN
ncbi:MAG: PAS domain-containing protein, partial [bacterium]